MEGTGGGGGGEGDEDDQLHWGDNVVVSVVGMCLCAAAAGVQVRSGSVTREYLLLSHRLYQLTSTSLSTEQQHFLRTGKYLRWEIFSCRRPLTLHAIPVFVHVTLFMGMLRSWLCIPTDSSRISTEVGQ